MGACPWPPLRTTSAQKAEYINTISFAYISTMSVPHRVKTWLTSVDPFLPKFCFKVTPYCCLERRRHSTASCGRMVKDSAMDTMETLSHHFVNVMRYINPRFTYLLFLLVNQKFISASFLRDSRAIHPFVAEEISRRIHSTPARLQLCVAAPEVVCLRMLVVIYISCNCALRSCRVGLWQKTRWECRTTARDPR